MILAIHGLGGSGRYWQQLADRVAGRLTIVAPDLAGFGMSDKPEIEYDRALHLADLDAVADMVQEMAEETIGDASVVVVGHSLGGVLGALWATRDGRRVTGLALAAAPYPQGGGIDRHQLREMDPGLGRRVVAAAARGVWPFVAVPIGLVRGYPPAVVMDFARPTPRSRAWTMATLLSDPEISHELEVLARKPRVPTLLMNAADDRRVSLRAQEAWGRLLPDAERLILPRGGHQLLLRGGMGRLQTWIDALPDP